MPGSRARCRLLPATIAEHFYELSEKSPNFISSLSRSKKVDLEKLLKCASFIKAIYTMSENLCFTKSQRRGALAMIRKKHNGWGMSDATLSTWLDSMDQRWKRISQMMSKGLKREKRPSWVTQVLFGETPSSSASRVKREVAEPEGRHDSHGSDRSENSDDERVEEEEEEEADGDDSADSAAEETEGEQEQDTAPHDPVASVDPLPQVHPAVAAQKRPAAAQPAPNANKRHATISGSASSFEMPTTQNDAGHADELFFDWEVDWGHIARLGKDSDDDKQNQQDRPSRANHLPQNAPPPVPKFKR